MGAKDTAPIAGEAFLPFTDRVAELQYLKSHVEAIIQRNGNLVFVLGEAGIGKTRLAGELKAYARYRGVRCLESKCYRSEERGVTPAYAPWIDFIREFAGESSIKLFCEVCGQDSRQILRLIPEFSTAILGENTAFEKDAPMPPEVVQKEETLFFQALCRFFFELSHEAPLLLLIDDWQWSDPASLRFLQFLRSRGIENHPLLVLCLYRDASLGEGGMNESQDQLIPSFLNDLRIQRSFNSISLERFTHQVYFELASKIFVQDDLNSELVETIYSKSGGNPLFVEETLKALVEQGVLVVDNEGNFHQRVDPAIIASIRIPETIRSGIRLRLKALAPRTAELLTLSSVLGGRFGFEILRRLYVQYGRELQVGALEAAVASGLLDEEKDLAGNAVYRLQDESVRDVLYEGLSLERRRQIHLLAAGTLEAIYSGAGVEAMNEHAGELAYHFQRGGNRTKALVYTIMAAEKSSRLYAHALACSHYHAALDLLPHIDEGGGRVLSEVPRESLPLRAKLLDSLGNEAQFVPSEFGSIVKCWEEAASIYEGIGEKRKASDILVKLGALYYLMVFDLVKSANSYNRAIELLKGESNAEAQLARIYVWGMIEDLWRGDREKILIKFKQAMEIAEKAAAYDAIVLVRTYPTAFTFPKEFEDAIASISKGMELGLEHKLFFETSFCYFHMADAYSSCKGDLQRALEIFNQGLDFTAKTGVIMNNLFCKVELVYGVLLPLGEWKKAREIAEEAASSVRGFPPSSLYNIVATSALGQVLLKQGELQRAEECLKKVEFATKGFGILQLDEPLYMALARVSELKSDRRDALRYLKEGYRQTRKRGVVVINAIPHVQLLIQMLEFELQEYSETSFEPDGSNKICEELRNSVQEIGEKWSFGYLHKAEALIAAKEGRLEEALQFMQMSIGIWRELGWKYELASSLYQLGEHGAKSLKFAQALESLSESLSLFSEMGDRIEIARIEALISKCKALQEKEVKRWTPKFDDTNARAVFDYLVGEFFQDYLVRKLPSDRCGWRSLRQIERESNTPASFLYGSTGGSGRVLKELLHKGVVESKVFVGERGRGGEITKIRIAYDTNEPLREYISEELKGTSLLRH